MSSINSTGSSASTNASRIVGLASGLDTDTIIENLMAVKKAPLNKLYQKKQLLQWQQEGYRSVISAIKGFYDTYFNSLNPATNMTSTSAYKKFTASSTDSAVVTAAANADAIAGTHTIKVKQLATAANTSTAATTSAIVGSDTAGLDYTSGNVNFNVTLNGQTKQVSIQNILYSDVSELAGEIQSKINTAFGSGKITVTGDVGTGKLSINTVSSSDRIALTSASGNDALDSLNITNGAANITTVTKNIVSSSASSLSYTSSNNKFDITIDGVTKTISLETSAYASAEALAKDIQTKIDGAFGYNKAAVSSDSEGKLSIVSVTGNSKITLTNSTSSNGLSDLGFSNNISNRLNTNDTLANLADRFNVPLTFSGGYLNFTINDKYFSIKSDTTLNSMISTINSSTAGVQMKYSEITDKITITSSQKGSGENIKIVNSGGNLFDASVANSAMGIASGSYSNGVDVIFDLDGLTDMTRNSNSFTIEGVTYSLKDIDVGEAKTITITQDVDATYNNIKNFVDKYNEVIAQINTKLDEDRDRDYVPLTDEQKKEMTDDEIEKWESKAKSGLFRNDSSLKKIISDLRRAVYDSINGVSGSISDIGITTSSNYLDKGKLVINETKLKEAISSNPEKVQNLFCKSSSISYSPTLTSAQSTQRYNEEGIANRFYDIIQNNIRTTRNLDGNKGFLIEKAGITGDLSEYKNTLTTSIDKIDINIEDMLDKLEDQQEKYYKLYANLETYINKMNSQSSWLSSQLNG